LQTFPRDAKIERVKKAKETMSSLAGLHNPDLHAGGKDIVADFGDRQVNSSIGPQWRPKIESLKKAVETVPTPLRDDTYLNVKLHKC
ncbi:polymorphic toxin type 15 domain-containing protein, partial [Pseudomonas syringae group genomosp. 3]